MKRSTMIIAASLALAGSAHADTVTGARDGGCRVEGGGFLNVASAVGR